MEEIKPAKRVPLSMKTAPDLRVQLVEAAAQNGRTITQEAEYRLQRSFDQETLVRDLAKVLKDS